MQSLYGTNGNKNEMKLIVKYNGKENLLNGLESDTGYTYTALIHREVNLSESANVCP